MRLQDYITDSARDAAKQAFQYARRVPEDKLGWAPEGGRSVLSICRELAWTPTWTLAAFNQNPEDWTEEDRKNYQQIEQAWKTVGDCEAKFNSTFPALETFFRGMSDEDLSRTKWLPYNGGRDHTWLEMTDYPRWNCTYHLGQICYLQTLYGDKDMV